MNQARPLPPLPPTIFDRAVDKVVISFRDWRFNRAKAALEHELARIVETANGHQAKHLPSRSARVRGAVPASQHQDRCVLRQTPRGTSLHRTRRAGAARTRTPDARRASGRDVVKGVGILIAVVVGAILLGCASGLVSTGYHWIVSLLVLAEDQMPPGSSLRCKRSSLASGSARSAIAAGNAPRCAPVLSGDVCPRRGCRSSTSNSARPSGLPRQPKHAWRTASCRPRVG